MVELPLCEQLFGAACEQMLRRIQLSGQQVDRGLRRACEAHRGIFESLFEMADEAADARGTLVVEAADVMLGVQGQPPRAGEDDRVSEGTISIRRDERMDVLCTLLDVD